MEDFSFDTGLSPSDRIDGIVIGQFGGFEDGSPRVMFSKSGEETSVIARTLIDATGLPLGAEVALAFENGNPIKPTIIGVIRNSSRDRSKQIDIDVQCQTSPLADEGEVVLRCGKASITLTREGKIILRGTYISSRSSGVNRIKGGSVQIN
jgi:hypothetical protein